MGVAPALTGRAASPADSSFVTEKNAECVRGEIHPPAIDSFWSLLNRGIMGSFHQVSRDYLPLYLNEFS